MGFEVVVDKELCMSSQDCVRLAPQAFALDDDGLSTPLPGAATADEGVLLEAAQQCPTNAIRVADDSGNVLYDSG